LFGRLLGDYQVLLYDQFQFPARNSGCSDPAPRWEQFIREIFVSIPRSEFWLFGLPAPELMQKTDRAVSIPRSEFWLFGRIERITQRIKSGEFQFPARNSGCSD